MNLFNLYYIEYECGKPRLGCPCSESTGRAQMFLRVVGVQTFVQLPDGRSAALWSFLIRLQSSLRERRCSDRGGSGSENHSVVWPVGFCRAPNESSVGA